MYDLLTERSLEQHRREMLYAGVVAAELWNTNPYRERGSKPVSALDFVPMEKKETPPQTLEEQIRILASVMGCGPGVN